MRLDIKLIDERIRKLKQLRNLALDEDFVDLFEQVIASNGNRKRAVPPENAASNGHSNSRAGKGEFTREIQEACNTFGATQFKAKQVVGKLEDNGYVFQAKNSYTATLGVLKKLVDTHKLKLIKKGKGRNPAIYANSDSVIGKSA
jgi:hypothetical protein